MEKKIKSFNEHFIIQNSPDGDKNSLQNLRSELEYIVEFELEPYEVITIIDGILNSSIEDNKEEREHLLTNYRRSKKDELTIKLIDRFLNK